MSAPVTEAHHKLAQSINKRWCSYDDAAQLIADSEAAATAELRAVFPQILAALGNGACCAPDVSVEFIQSIPNEVAGVVAQLRADVEQWELAFQEQYAQAESAERELELRKRFTSRTAIAEHRAERAEAEVDRLRHLEAVLRSSAADMTAGSITAGGVADLRAENERLRRAYVRPDDIRAQLESAVARAESAEREVERLKSDGAASAFITMSCRASHAEAELAKERARLDWMDNYGYENGANVNEWAIALPENQKSNTRNLRAAIDAAMKDDLK